MQILTKAQAADLARRIRLLDHDVAKMRRHRAALSSELTAARQQIDDLKSQVSRLTAQKAVAEAYTQVALGALADVNAALGDAEEDCE